MCLTQFLLAYCLLQSEMNETKVRKNFCSDYLFACLMYKIYVYNIRIFNRVCYTWSNCDLTIGKMCIFHHIICYRVVAKVCVVCCKRQRENLSARALHYENFSLFLLQTFFPSIAFHTGLWNIADDTNIEKLNTIRISNGLFIECCWYSSCSFISIFLESEYCHFFTIHFLCKYAEKEHKKYTHNNHN